VIGPLIRRIPFVLKPRVRARSFNIFIAMLAGGGQGSGFVMGQREVVINPPNATLGHARVQRDGGSDVGAAVEFSSQRADAGANEVTAA